MRRLTFLFLLFAPTLLKAQTAIPTQFGYTDDFALGLIDNKIYSQKSYPGEWNYLFTFQYPLEKASLSVVDGSKLLYDRHDDNLFYFDLSGKLLTKISKKTMLTAFGKSGISEIIFSQGSSGCFHSTGDQVIFRNKGSYLGDPLEGRYNKKPRFRSMPGYEDEIDQSEVNVFLNKLPELFDPSPKTTIQDFKFSETDYKRLRNDISKGELYILGEDNPDMNRLLKLVDSVKYLDTRKLNECLMNLDLIVSTSTYWKQITFINAKNEKLVMISRFFEEHVYFSPWIVTLNGYKVITTNIEINQFLDSVYPGFWKKGNKIDVLHSLVRQIY